MNPLKKFEPLKFISDNIVTVIFLALTIIAIPFSRLSGIYILSNLIDRFARSAFLVFALILPIMAGMGINFAMVLGATAGQIGLIFAIDYNVMGIQGLLLATCIGVPLSIFLGWFCGQVLNRARGREMVTGFILGYFMDGVYQFFGLYVMGWLIPIRTREVMQVTGSGVRNTLALGPVRGGLDNILNLQVGPFHLPLLTFGVIAFLCLFIIWFRKTKLGHDMRAIGQDQGVSHSAGIAVDRTRIMAIVISTILACIGQIIYLQNMGNMGTYTSQRQAGYFAAAAILVGGATVSKATIMNVFVGVFLVHSLYITMPIAGKEIFKSAMVGQYMSDFINYAIIALALVLHAWRNKRNADLARAGLRGHADKDSALAAQAGAVQ
ncbi:MAG: ABC transporter [Spirochaetes bacterium GWD1_61_31]|nr:MAG: ABC transporter [Spirochaetes bacterium GWB1_60_80]OHD34104.1 MAG: ABC transporter [Spirochaetes bacterium GWC1_61_12]OHD35406.1 MAG: ABC transporter [Spirochaetes bacterium GWD1_61_31]OHD44914.1 MAG: ABC transporter [Spirochaetes bacterium GWE1_60_18]OHD60025.1 MAG: ABC transporter [Spirochaetes bacterium GWF1_60_12]HAP43709.1 ABC transporter permease [Spirochaetaceae bacterium]